MKLWANRARCELSPDVPIRCSIFPLFEKFARRENTRLTIYRKSAELFTRSQGMQVVETSLVAQTEFQEWKLLASCELRRLWTEKEARTSVRESTRIELFASTRYRPFHCSPQALDILPHSLHGGASLKNAYERKQSNETKRFLFQNFTSEDPFPEHLSAFDRFD